MTAITRRDADIDPLTAAMAPPPNESEEDRQARLAAEHAAKVRSDAIDEELNRQRQAEKKAPKQVKVLLLGQSESGKSTTLKNFQLMHSPKAFRAERALWKAVIQLNIVRSIRLILDSMTEAQEAHSSPVPSTYSTSSSSRPASPLVEKEYPRLSPDLLKLKMRLSPLLSVEEALTRTLAPSGSSELEATRLIPLRYSSRSNTPPKEPSVYAGALWKGALGRLMSSDRGNDADDREEVVWDDPKDSGLVLHACAADMTQLWNDPTVRKLLEVQRLRLEEMAGFFLDSLDRVTAPKYVPSDDDILRARLKTLGVSEHRFKLKTAAWVPYFDDVEAIIFLAPISCFDQVLQEDPSVNRLEDSILLWKAIVSNPLLKHTSMILFLNKCDIMKAKLASGIQFSKYVISYADRPNNFETASNYLRKKFSGIHKQCSPKSRSYYCHFTSVIDTSSTLHILQNVQDVLLRSNLEQSSLV
ncbi:hypothetical protein EYR40_006830 [Pleurotus pulmonarius]|nr:hypothetical protein EYR36_003885 [Pleurotus pulmonarius]KAF4599731.1 hypothetical protein EYR40_006830 [Pleurotus pulmonarius]